MSDWDDLIDFDPYQSSLEQGKEEGRVAGSLAGYRDGRALGRTKGMEFGMEVGFIRGFLNALLEEEEEMMKEQESSTTSVAVSETERTSTDDGTVGSNKKAERLKRSMKELEKALDNFPTPDEVFENIQTRQQIQEGQQQQYDEDGLDDDSEKTLNDNRNQNDGSSDILGKMQRIRARFKLLTVQLGMSQFSLKHIMDQVILEETVNVENNNQNDENGGGSSGDGGGGIVQESTVVADNEW